MEKSFKFVWFLATPIMFGIMAVSRNLVPWFLGEEYKESIYILMIGSVLILAIGLNNVTGIQYLIPAKKQNLYTKSVVFGALINFILNLILIPKYNAIGAIISSVIAEVTIFVIQIIYVKDIISCKSIFAKSHKNIFAGFIMFVVVYFLGTKMSLTIVTSFIQIFVGTVIYIILTYILKDELLIELINLISKKIKRH